MKIANKSMFSFAILGLSVFGISNLFVGSAYANPDGAPAYYTGAPKDKGTCTTCHTTFPINTGPATFSILSRDSITGTTTTTYAPGQTITFRVAFGNTVGTKWGFEMTAKDASYNRVGTFSKNNSLDTSTWVIPVGKKGLLAADAGKYIESTLAGNTKKIWFFKWTAPATSVGPVKFYVAGADCNGNGGKSGDYGYRRVKTLNPQ